MKKWLLLPVGLILFLSLYGQRKLDNLVIVTLDGMRWQEVFGGTDSLLMTDHKFNSDSATIASMFWSPDIEERRKKLFPFLWTTVLKEGQLYGNRQKESFVNVANTYRFSYPGYNEIFTGFPDSLVNSNDKIPNKNGNVLEFINLQDGFVGKVAAFTSWDVFPYILNAERSGMYVNADEKFQFDNPQLKLINEMQSLTARPLDVRPDLLTYMAAREYLKAYHPRILYIGFDETDDYAHKGKYDQYLKSAHAEDAMLADLWQIVQSIPEYSGRTTLIVTCDHGRGDKIKKQWTSHGQRIEGSDEIWIAAIGPHVHAAGEMKNTPQLYQGQLAATFASILGFKFNSDHPVMKRIEEIDSN